MKKLSSEFESLLKQAKEFIVSDPSAEQAVAVQTSKETIFCFRNHDVCSGNTADEAAFVKTLSENKDTKIRYAVCMWEDFSLDVPSRHLRNLLVGLDSFNRETEILLRSGEGFVTKPLKFMLDKV